MIRCIKEEYSAMVVCVILFRLTGGACCTFHNFSVVDVSEVTEVQGVTVIIVHLAVYEIHSGYCYFYHS